MPPANVSVPTQSLPYLGRKSERKMEILVYLQTSRSGLDSRQ